MLDSLPAVGFDVPLSLSLSWLSDSLASEGPRDGGSFDIVKIAARQRFLTQSEECELANRYFYAGCQESGKQILLSHLRILPSVAWGFKGYGLDRQDLIQEGVVGLLKALRKFDPSRNVRFFTFATHWVRAEMMAYIQANARIVRISTTANQRKLFFKLGSRLGGKSWTDAEVHSLSLEFCVPERDVREMERRMRGFEFSLDPIYDSDDGHSFISVLESEGSDPSDVIQSRQFSEVCFDRIEESMGELNEREAMVVRSRWLGGTENVPTMKDLSVVLGVSTQRVAQIEQSAFKKMRDSIRSRL